MSIVITAILTHTLVGILSVVLYKQTHTRIQDITHAEVMKITQIIENLKWAHVNDYNILIKEWEKELATGLSDIGELSIPLQGIIAQVRKI